MAESYDKQRLEDIKILCQMKGITPLELCAKLEDRVIELEAAQAKAGNNTALRESNY